MTERDDGLHQTSLLPIGWTNGGWRYLPTCSCGWKGAIGTPTTAEAEREEHSSSWAQRPAVSSTPAKDA